MPVITILEKLYDPAYSKTFEKLFSNFVKGLDVQLNFVGTTNRGWIKLDVSGDDETIALNLLSREVGLVPDALTSLKKYSVVKGKITSFNKDVDEIHVDLGITSFETYDAVLSKKQLCAQLTDGKDISLQSLVNLFCMYDNVPLEVVIIEKVGEHCMTVNAVLSETQLSLLKSWVRYRFDRLIILGPFFTNVEHAIKISRHTRDIIKIESLGVLTHIVLCKLGTDAIGLIPKLGRYLRSATFLPFSPRIILETIDSRSIDLYL